MRADQDDHEERNLFTTTPDDDEARGLIEGSRGSSIRIGTSGFSYDDWHGTFYPATLRPTHRLEYYAAHFSTVEINSTFYQLPALPSVVGMIHKVPHGFTFFVKGHRDLTHITRNAKETLPRFMEMLKPYQAEGDVKLLV